VLICFLYSLSFLLLFLLLLLLILQRPGSSVEEDPEAAFDINADKHRGQFALRKLYHESDRLIAVLYTAPSCGPCRSLKPIFNGVVNEFKGRIHYVEVRRRVHCLLSPPLDTSVLYS
jgi:thiol-disulfide isomerase/thioredoxin